jgi:hypothetical protein
MIVRSQYEGDQTALYLGTPFDANSALKCAIIAQGRSNYSRANLCFCLDDTANNDQAYNASTGNCRMRIEPDGRIFQNWIVAITNHLFISSQYNTGSSQITVYNNGLNYQQNNSASWAISSDKRIKEEIETADYDICFNNVKNIELRRFKYSPLWKDRKFNDNIQLGFIAQEVEQFYPKSINITKEELTDGTIIEDCRSVDLNQMNFTLYGAVKKIMKIVDAQNERIQALENIISKYSS